ncbi:hypothetical protein HRE53_29405 (plasmid) [Acaryochloris sp. 'Moss Beach']|uniref:hypothetical protein n=1 Tax=Acaryochloris TaxID=155977 RepID=UPI001BB0C9C6|nr:MULTISPECIES: hypothetical protein [Acaryochloris]QUY45796.1 hypothetical protein I1H34_29050 [Acaryochloris marina S15]UJB72877.1 hypothetical protein HRE53_29405 [Acaryochloris sp. 'Moss Beach']
MRLITSIQVKQAEHTEVIDTAATQVGLAANKAFLFVIRKEIQGWKNLTALISWGLSKVEQKHGPIFEEVKGRTVAVFRKGCQQETVFVQGLIKTQLTDRLDAHWELHDKAIDWFKVQTQAFLADSPVEDTSEVDAEDQAPDVAEDLEELASVAEVEEPISEVEESPVLVFDPDPLDDELGVPQNPTPVVASGGGKRRTAKKKVESSLSSMMREEAAKS